MLRPLNVVGRPSYDHRFTDCGACDASLPPLVLIMSLSDAVDVPTAKAIAAVDPYLWLEDVTAEKALEWARTRNAESAKPAVASTARQPCCRSPLVLEDQHAEA